MKTKEIEFTLYLLQQEGGKMQHLCPNPESRSVPETLVVTAGTATRKVVSRESVVCRRRRGWTVIAGPELRW